MSGGPVTLTCVAVAGYKGLDVCGGRVSDNRIAVGLSGGSGAHVAVVVAGGGEVLRERSEDLRDDLHAPRPAQQSATLGGRQVAHVSVVCGKTEQSETESTHKGVN